MIHESWVISELFEIISMFVPRNTNQVIQYLCFITIITDDISLVKLNEMCWLDLRCWHWRVVFCTTSPFLEVRLPILLELLKRQRQRQNKDNGNDNDKYTGEQCFVGTLSYLLEIPILFLVLPSKLLPLLF